MIISIFKEDNVFSTNDSLPYGLPLNRDIDYYRNFVVKIKRVFSYFFFVRLLYFLLQCTILYILSPRF